MAETTLREAKNAIETAWCHYGLTVMTVAEKVFNSEIKPYLEKYHLKFISGNGDFTLFYTDETPKWFVERYKQENRHGNHIDVYKISNRIFTILQTEIPGYPCESLGTCMPCYPEVE